MRNAHKMLVGCLTGKDHLEGLAVDEKIILKYILRKEGGRM
jgi:hypothetical protein